VVDHITVGIILHQVDIRKFQQLRVGNAVKLRKAVLRSVRMATVLRRGGAVLRSVLGAKTVLRRGGAVLRSVLGAKTVLRRGGAVLRSVLGAKSVLRRGGAVLRSVLGAKTVLRRGGAALRSVLGAKTVLIGSAVKPARILTMNSAVKMEFGSV